MRTMYDSTDPAAIPVPVALVGGYVTGYDQNWPPAAWARFGSAVQVRICTRGGVDDGDVLDMEGGAATVADAVPWLQLRRRSTGVWKSLYYSVSLDLSVQQALQAGGIPSVQVPKWAAWYNGKATLADVTDPSGVNIVGVVAKQYANSAITGGDYDASVVAEYWPGIDADPPSTHKRRKRGMFDVVYVGSATGHYLVDSDGTAQSTTAGPTDGSEIGMDGNAFNAFLAARAAAWKNYLAAQGSGGGGETPHVHTVPQATTSSAG